MKEELLKNHMKIKFLEKKEKYIKHVIEPAKDKTKSPVAVSKGKKKHVAFAEQAKNVVVGRSEPVVRVFKSKFKYVKKMRHIAKSLGRIPFSQWKEY